ncbi:helix-turn-helix domain-containing protein [Rhodoferax ferrireducens]|uniref:helix-turn-helix domain-containing protein n=1 Tax=Rhodoferax ferrireducens TaxID=192843 RepID=UPI003BB6BA6E
MDVKTLIDTATKVCSQTQAQLAAEMGKSPARISDWRKGHWKPDASEIAFLADKAGLPVIPTVIELQAEMNPRYASIWKKAVSELRQNQG